jgi:hypothetical protein
LLFSRKIVKNALFKQSFSFTTLCLTILYSPPVFLFTKRMYYLYTAKKKLLSGSESSIGNLSTSGNMLICVSFRSLAEIAFRFDVFSHLASLS